MFFPPYPRKLLVTFANINKTVLENIFKNGGQQKTTPDDAYTLSSPSDPNG